MATTRPFITATGQVYKSATQRRHIVVNTRNGWIIYRTDDATKARKRAGQDADWVVATRRD